MQSEMVKSICRVGIFIICAQVLVHFRPAKSYEKYFKMLVSAMILVQLLGPVGALWKGGRTQGAESKVQWYEEQLRISREKAESDLARGEELREQMTLAEVRRRVAEGASAGEQGAREERAVEEQGVWTTEGSSAQTPVGAGPTDAPFGGAVRSIGIESIPPVEEIRIDLKEGGEQRAKLEGAAEISETPMEDPMERSMEKMVPAG